MYSVFQACLHSSEMLRPHRALALRQRVDAPPEMDGFKGRLYRRPT